LFIFGVVDPKAEWLKTFPPFGQEKAEKIAFRLLIPPFLVPHTVEKTEFRLSQPV